MDPPNPVSSGTGMSVRLSELWSAMLTPSAAVDGSELAVLRNNRHLRQLLLIDPHTGIPIEMGTPTCRARLALNATSPEWPSELANAAQRLHSGFGWGRWRGQLQGPRAQASWSCHVAVQFVPETVEALLGWVLGTGEPLEGGPMGGGSIIPSRARWGPCLFGVVLSSCQCLSSRAGKRKGIQTSTSRKAARLQLRKRQSRV